MDREAIENQWLRLGSMSLADIPGATDGQIGIIEFWTAVWDIKEFLLTWQKLY